MRITLLFCVLFLFCSCAVSPRDSHARVIHNASDEELQSAAVEAMGDREGTAIVIDPRTGRIRAIVNPRPAFEQAYPPGSSIKPFTALTSLRSGRLTALTSRQCKTRYTSENFEIACSHPRSQSPLNLRQALAYSCNDYFAHVSERLNQGAFISTLKSFGFGARTGISAAESEGKLPENEWRLQDALGEGDSLLVTPIQLLSAYNALVNGGHLYRPWSAQNSQPANTEIRNFAVAPDHRRLLVESMRDVILYGTASRSGLSDLPFYVFGKTGTSTSSNGFRTQGWFVGFVADNEPSEIPAADRINLGILVFLKRAHGSECAEIARRIISREVPAITQINYAIAGHDTVKVRSISEGITRELPLEDYTAGVLAAESSIEKQPEALKAQAIVSRTFALKNLGRHAGEGYDFCSTTHCQRFIPATGASFQISKRAVESTRGQVLADSSGKNVDAYFHAACGGMTANIEDLWGIAAPEYLQGVRDEYCKLMPHRHWSARIPANRLAQAMRSDKRTDIGRVLKSIKVSKYDRTGRAQWIWIEGDKIKAVRGWEFKIVAGRKLGWQLIKSSRFNVSRSGDDFIFTGTGFGHGLGLCQEGSHVMAARGLDYRRILKFYFPHTGLKTVNDSELVQVDFRPSRQTFTGDHFRLLAGRGTDQKALARAMSIFEAARKDLLLRLESASLNVDESRPYEVIIHSSTSDFISATGQSGWVSGVTRGRRIELQPLKLLEKRGVLETSLRHETAHAIIERLGGGAAPRWLAEGLAIHFAGEAPGLSKTRTLPLLSRDELERRLAKPASAQVSRELYKAAFLEVRRLITSQGEPAAWRLAARYFNSSRS